MVPRGSSRIDTEFHSSSSLKMLHKMSRRAAGAVSFSLNLPAPFVVSDDSRGTNLGLNFVHF